MPAPTAPTIADIWLIRHAPALDGGAMAGRRDVAADCGDAARLAAIAARIGLDAGDQLHISPALRCRQTAKALFPHRPAPPPDPHLWEQDFGAWEGRAYADLPDLGPMPQADLALFAPPGGESFADLAQRFGAALRGWPAGRHVVVAHAGIVRAALGIALGAVPLGLSFAVAPLSITHLGRDVQSGVWSVHCVNWTWAP